MTPTSTQSDPRGGAHKSRTARTFDLLHEAIVNAAIPPGEKLRIDALSKSLDASSGAVREALSRLTAEGLVIAEPQKGFVVAPISRRDLTEMTEVRIEIECRCLADSIRHGSLDWEGRVLSLQHRLRALDWSIRPPIGPEAAQWHALHMEFHDELAGACPNRWRLRLRRQLFVQSERYRRLSSPVDESDRDVTAEHDEIADAAITRDAKAAAAAMARHLQRTTDILLASRLPFSDDPAKPAARATKG